MAKLSTLVTKTIFGLTASAILMPIMSTKASAIGLAGALTAANDITSIASNLSSNGSGNYGSCSNNQYETNFGRPSLTITVSCTFNFVKGNWFGRGTAGKSGWESFYQMYNWSGQPGKKYSLTQTLSGYVSAYAEAKGSGVASSYSYLYDGYNGKQIRANANSYFIGNGSDYKSLNEQISRSTNSLSNGTLYLGAYILGYAYTDAIGYTYANSYISFTSKATITDMGSSIPNWIYGGGGASLSSSSYDDTSELYTENNPSLTPPEDVPVPEPVTMVGFALGGTMLLAGKGSRFRKRVSRNAEKAVDTTAIEV